MLLLDYEFIVYKHELEGMSYRKIWMELNPPIKFQTFKSAVVHYKLTRKKRICLKMDDSYRYKPLNV